MRVLFLAIYRLCKHPVYALKGWNRAKKWGSPYKNIEKIEVEIWPVFEGFGCIHTCTKLGVAGISRRCQGYVTLAV